MSRKKAEVPTSEWVKPADKERRGEQISLREQKTKGVPPPPPKAPDGSFYNIGG